MISSRTGELQLPVVWQLGGVHHLNLLLVVVPRGWQRQFSLGLGHSLHLCQRIGPVLIASFHCDLLLELDLGGTYGTYGLRTGLILDGDANWMSWWWLS